MMIFCDSFSHYDNALLGKMWDVVGVPIQAGVSITQSLTSGRFGAGGVTFVGPTSDTSLMGSSATDIPQYIQKNYSGVSTIHAGLAILQTKTQCSRGARMLAFLDGANVQVSLDIMPSGQIRATRNSTAGTGIYLGSTGAFDPPYTVIGISTDSILSNAYDFLQIKVVHHPTAGSIEIRRGDDSVFWLLENVNTAISGSNNSSSVLLGGYAVQGEGSSTTSVENHHLNAIISDFHLLNTTVNGDDALDPVTFIGDRHWEVRTPTVDGFYTDWTPSTGSNHAALVDEIPPNDTDYNSTATVDNIDSFETDIPTGPTTASVIMAYTMYLEKDAGGDTGVRGLFRLSGADRTGTEFQVPNPFAFKQSFLASKPGGGAITVQDCGDGEHGYKLSS